MPRYFFDVHDGSSLPDLEGTELASLDDAKREAVRYSGALLSDDPSRFWYGQHWSVEVKDDTGALLFSLSFRATEVPVPATVVMAVPSSPESENGTN